MVSFFTISPLQADDGLEKAYIPHPFGIAMNGAPQQTKDETHLSYANEHAPQGGHLKQSEIGTFDTVNPYSIKGKAAAGLNLIYDKLMARSWNEPFTLYPLIAERIDVTEDRSGFVIHLNPDAKFNDGSAISADDIIFSFNTLKEKGRPNMRRVYKQVADIQKITPTSVRMTFGDDYNRETVMIMAMMPVLSKAWWEGRDFEDTLLEMPNSSGAYVIEDIKPGSKITFRKNENYWAKDLFASKGMNNFEIISYDYFRDQTGATESFLKGDLNLRRENDPRKWEENYNNPAIEKLEFKHGRPQPAEALIFNTRCTLFEDIKVRQALFYAFDGNWMKVNFFQDSLKRTNSYFANSVLSAEKPVLGADLSKRERLHKAQSLLQEAGWNVKNNKLSKNGKPFTFEILINESKNEKIVLAFIQTLKRLGVTANVRTLDSATFQNRLLDYNYDMVLHKWQNSLSPGTEQMVYWGCDAAKQTGRFNYAGICSQEIDDTAQKIANAQTYEDLTENARKLDGLLIDSVISIPLFYSDKDFIAVQKNTFQVPAVTPIYGPVIEAWSVQDKDE